MTYDVVAHAAVLSSSADSFGFSAEAGFLRCLTVASFSSAILQFYAMLCERCRIFRRKVPTRKLGDAPGDDVWLVSKFYM